MTSRWEHVVSALGLAEHSDAVKDLIAGVGEEPQITEDPLAYQDTERRTRYYSFLESGLVLGFRKGLLSHAHFYVEPHEGFRPYADELPAELDRNASAKSILFRLGQPDRQGGGEMDDLLGYILPWARYVRNGYDLHVEFGDSGGLRKVTLVREG
jgi:hypothetical protein